MPNQEKEDTLIVNEGELGTPCVRGCGNIVDEAENEEKDQLQLSAVGIIVDLDDEDTSVESKRTSTTSSSSTLSVTNPLSSTKPEDDHTKATDQVNCSQAADHSGGENTKKNVTEKSQESNSSEYTVQRIMATRNIYKGGEGGDEESQAEMGTSSERQNDDPSGHADLTSHTTPAPTTELQRSTIMSRAPQRLPGAYAFEPPTTTRRPRRPTSNTESEPQNISDPSMAIMAVAIEATDETDEEKRRLEDLVENLQGRMHELEQRESNIVEAVAIREAHDDGEHDPEQPGEVLTTSNKQYTGHLRRQRRSLLFGMLLLILIVVTTCIIVLVVVKKEGTPSSNNNNNNNDYFGYTNATVEPIELPDTSMVPTPIDDDDDVSVPASEEYDSDSFYNVAGGYPKFGPSLQRMKKRGYLQCGAFSLSFTHDLVSSNMNSSAIWQLI